MPNWCHNIATFTCPSKDIYDKLLFAIQNDNWFETFAPLGLDKEEFENGWDYNVAVEKWGTKWSPCDLEILTTDEENMIIEISCDTAWSPPNGVYKTMNKEFNIVTEAVYEELGSEFFGRCFYENGKEVDNSYEIPSNLQELNELRKVIGTDLDDYMTSTWEQLMEDWQNEEDEHEDDEEDDENDENDEDDEEDDVEVEGFEFEEIEQVEQVDVEEDKCKLQSQ
jgi:hypothetical protein